MLLLPKRSVAQFPRGGFSKLLTVEFGASVFVAIGVTTVGASVAIGVTTCGASFVIVAIGVTTGGASESRGGWFL